MDSRLLAEWLRDDVDASFNRITVDGDMSTNDSVFLLANGRSGVAIRRGSAAAHQFRELLGHVTQRLAYLLIQDGEGATSVLKIRVQGARTGTEAQRCARQAASSLLVKTMLAGRDPNVGRLAAAVGASGVAFDPARLDIRLEGFGVVVAQGILKPFDAKAARRWLQPQSGTPPAVVIDLHTGRASSSILTCDLTEEYVRINAHYST